MSQHNKKIYAADGFRFDSREEMDFYFFIMEGYGSGMISAWGYHPQTITLAPKVTYQETIRTKTKEKQVERHLLNGCSYTPDFTIMLGGPRSWMLRKLFYGSDLIWVDVKGTYQQHNDDVKFSLIQKWVYQKKKIYINKIIPQKLFEAAFVPKRAAYNHNGTRRTCYAACRTRNEFLQQHENMFEEMK